MPSSSTRSTELEKALRHFYKIAFLRLYSSNMMPQAHFVTKQYAEILDMGESDLMATLEPVYHGETASLEKYKTELKVWNELETSNCRMRRSDKLCSAGNAMADTGATLFKVGREKEAMNFCEWGESFEQSIRLCEY